MPPSPPCWIGFCTMDTFSNAARAAEEPKQAGPEKANDRSNNSKTKNDKDAGQRTPGGVATRDPRASHAGASPQEYSKKRETFPQPAHQADCGGPRSPIPSEPAPCHRPWITLQGATPEERNQHIKLDFDDSIVALQSHTMAR